MAYIVQKIAEKHVIAKTNQVLLGTFVGGGLLICAAAAAVYDVGAWFGAW